MARRMLFIACLRTHFCPPNACRDVIFLIQRHEVEVFSLLSGRVIQRFIFVYPSTCFPLVFVILFVCFVDASRNFEFRSLIASGRGHTYVWFVVIKVGAFVCLWLFLYTHF